MTLAFRKCITFGGTLIICFQMTTPQLIDLYYRERLDDQQLLMHQYHTIGEVPPYGNSENIFTK